MSGEAPTDPIPGSGPPDYASRLQAVEKYIGKSLFAQVSRHVRPYTDQQKLDIRHRIEEDKEAYDEADLRQWKSCSRYIRLRYYTAIILVCFLSAAIISLLIGMPYFFDLFKRIITSIDVSSVFTIIVLSILVLMIGVISILVRLHVRGHVLSDIDDDVRSLAFYVVGRFNSIKKETTDACIQIDTRASNGEDGWAKRARGWSRIALWSTIRGDQLDRYATNVLWKMEVLDTRVEAVSRFFKGWILYVGIFVLFYAAGSTIQRDLMVSGPSIAAIFIVSFVLWPVISYFMFIKQKEFIRQQSWVIQLLCMIAIYVPIASIWYMNGSMKVIDLAAPLIGFLIVAIFWFGWIVMGEKDDSLCTHNFRETLNMDKQSVPNTSFYFDILSDRIQNLVEQITDKDRSGSTRGTPPPPK